MASLPPTLAEIVTFFDGLTEVQRRDALLSYAAEAPRHAPCEEETYVAVDDREHPGCVDTVILCMAVTPTGGIRLRAGLGPEVQTLTRALVAILCRGLEGCPLQAVANLPDDFIPAIVGEQLMRSRARSVYHVLRRLRESASGLLEPSKSSSRIDPNVRRSSHAG